MFDVGAEASRVAYTVCRLAGGGRAARTSIDDGQMDGGAQINTYPPGNLVGFRDLDSLVNCGANQLAVVTPSGVFLTTNIGADPIDWQQLGRGVPDGACGVGTARAADGMPTFLRVGAGSAAFAGPAHCGVMQGPLRRVPGHRSSGTAPVCSGWWP